MAAYFFLELLPPRPGFISDMTNDERQLMFQHAAYMAELFRAGKVLIYGPVMHVQGAFGMGVFDAAGEAEVRELMDADPTIRAGMNTYRVSPMQVGGAQGNVQPQLV